MIATQKEGLEKRKRVTGRAVLARIRGAEIESIEGGRYFCPRDHEVDNAIDKRQPVHEEEVLATDKVGREILKLRIERERLLDVVWLATSSVQVRALWSKASCSAKDPRDWSVKRWPSSRRRMRDDRADRCVRSRTMSRRGLSSKTGEIELRREPRPG